MHQKFFYFFLTVSLVMLNKKIPRLFLIFNQSDYLIQVVDTIPVIFLGVRPASCTHNFARGRKKLASVSPVDS